MIAVGIGYLGWAALAILFILAYSVYLRTRAVGNSLLALAGKEFHDKISRALESADELPDAVLDFVEFMIDTANEPRGHWSTYRTFRRLNSAVIPSRRSATEGANAMEVGLKSLRPQVRTIIDEASVMWLNWMISRNVFVGLMISLESRKLALRRGAVDAGAVDVEKSLFSNARRQSAA